ncbi:BTAD domain-containing putative transcriptional regulator [Streptosporangium soli]|nr:winged helix-turn-helix domain-containing protein [Streptosporangium sp. KLBMP 9127]
MRIDILGPLKVSAGDSAGDEVVEVGGARLRALLVRLALDPGRLVTFDQLTDSLWGDSQPADRANALQSLVSRLRRVLPGADLVRSDPGGYRLDVPREAIDAYRFERLAGEGRRALDDGDPETAARRLNEALGLWRGRALADVTEAPFAASAVTWLDEAWLVATEDRVQAELANGGHARLVAELQDLTARHPLRERLRDLLLRALYAAGRQAEALEDYEGFRRRLAGELGVDPGPELQRTHLAVLRADPSLRAAARPRGNLRTPLTSFVGRAPEIERIGRQLKESRLVTLVGPGGAGKTRLATTVAADSPHATWLVELASVTDPDDVPQAVLGALGDGYLDRSPTPAAAPATLARLVEALSIGEPILVLDNCEHLIDPVARLAEELLGRCPRLRVLATSREPLGILGEALCPVPPLPLPVPGVPPEGSPAVRLFLDRVTAVRPGFRLTGDNTALVVEVCRRLDGLPLAIELAAARLRSLTLDQVAERLDDRFRLLSGGSRTALPRHQTLRAVVDWSWELLDDEERRFAEALAVFPAGVTTEAAEHLGGNLDLLAALVDKSLLQQGEGPRYRMLETIREYALERLARSGRVTELRAAHAAYFLELAERAEPHLRGVDQLRWIHRLLAERDNLLAALHFAADARDADTAVRLAAALGMFWTIRGNHVEAVGWFRLALDVPGESPEQARLIVTALFLISKAITGGYARLEGVAERMRAISVAAGVPRSHPVLLVIEPVFALFTDDIELGLSVIGQRLGHPDPWVRGVLLTIRAALKENDGDMAGSRMDLVASVAELRAMGERWALSMALTSLAEAHSLFGDFDGAIPALEEAIKLTRELNPDDDFGHQKIWLASVRIRQGDMAKARAELLEMIEPGERRFAARNIAFARLSLGDLARIDGDLDEAADQYERASHLIEESSFVAPQFRALVLAARAHLAVDRGDPEAAGRLAVRGVEYALETKDMPVVAKLSVAVSARWACLGEFRTAAVALGAAEQLRGAPDRFNPDVARLIDRLRAELGDAAFTAAYAHGSGLSRADALAQVKHL